LKKKTPLNHGAIFLYFAIYWSNTIQKKKIELFLINQSLNIMVEKFVLVLYEVCAEVGRLKLEDNEWYLFFGGQ
jgi:hypothetical protein